MTTLESSLIFIIFLVVIIFTSFIKKIYYRYYLKKRFYIIPHVSTKGIASIGMVIALSISVVLLLTTVTADIAAIVFRAWAGSRIMLEGILIKIGGLLFGPIIGMCIGAAVDFLTVSLTAGVFHIGYFIGAMFFGLIGGLIKNIISLSKKNEFLFNIYSSILLILVGISSCLILYFIPGDSNIFKTFKFSILNISIIISMWHMFVIISIIILFSISFVWISFLYKTKKKKDKNSFSVFIPVFITVVVSELIINLVMMPGFDNSLSTLGYDAWLLIRMLILVPMIILNILIIYPVFKIVTPIVRYDYELDLVEDLKKPVYTV